MYYIGIDLGGTNIAAGVVDEKGNIKSSCSTPTLKERHYEEIIDDMAKMATLAVKKAGLTMNDIESVGIGCPGVVDNKEGVIKHLSNMGMTNVPLRKLMESRLNKKIVIDNDANAAALGEYMLYGDGCESFIFVTLGTGIGGGIILNGKIYSGFNGAGAELGHMSIYADGLPCPCGCKGCWEQYGSVTALVNMTKEAIKNHPDSEMAKWVEKYDKINGRTAFDCAKMGDIAAKEVVDTYIKHIGYGLISIINMFQPEKIVIGGGISKEGDYLLRPLREMVYACKYNNYVERTKLEIAKLFNDAGIIGAAFCAVNSK